jgi:outer membrane protein
VVVKRTIVTAVAVLAFSGAAYFTAFSGFTTTARAQNSGQKELEHKIGLIDMAEVFKEYNKFKALREDLKVDILASDRKAKALAGQAKTIADKLKSNTFTEGSPEYKRLEDQLIELKTEFNSFKAKVQRDSCGKNRRSTRRFISKLLTRQDFTPNTST